MSPVVPMDTLACRMQEHCRRLQPFWFVDGPLYRLSHPIMLHSPAALLTVSVGFLVPLLHKQLPAVVRNDTVRAVNSTVVGWIDEQQAETH